MSRKKYSQPEEGYCKICNKKVSLTDDHAPPKCCGNKSKVYIRHGAHETIRQNGANFKTLCQSCNNNLLGSEYDPHLGKLFHDAQIAVRNMRLLPTSSIYLQINSAAVCRAIAGHFLAADATPDATTKPTKAVFANELQKFVLNRKYTPKNIDFYYWYYPYDTIRFINFFCMSPDVVNIGSTPVYGALFKFFPLAVWMIDRESSTTFPRFDRLSPNSTEYRILLKLAESKAEQWPELPGKNGIAMHSENALGEASPNSRKSK